MSFSCPQAACDGNVVRRRWRARGRSQGVASRLPVRPADRPRGTPGAGYRAHAQKRRTRSILPAPHCRRLLRRDYVARALQGCTNDTERDVVRAAIRQIAKSATTQGDFDQRDWSTEPLPLCVPSVDVATATQALLGLTHCALVGGNGKTQSVWAHRENARAAGATLVSNKQKAGPGKRKYVVCGAVSICRAVSACSGPQVPSRARRQPMAWR